MPNTKVVGIIFPYILTPIPNLYDHSFPRYGQITCLTFRRPTTLTFDLKFWKYLSVTVYPYVICMPSFIMIGWEMAEILHFEILRKHGQTHKHTPQTHKQTDMGITIPRPPPMGGEVITILTSNMTISKMLGQESTYILGTVTNNDTYCCSATCMYYLCMQRHRSS